MAVWPHPPVTRRQADPVRDAGCQPFLQVAGVGEGFGAGVHVEACAVPREGGRWRRAGTLYRLGVQG